MAEYMGETQLDRHASLSIVPFEIGFAPACRDLIEALPNWFGIPEANVYYLQMLEVLPAWIAISGRDLVGVISLDQCFPHSFEVHFLAVHPQHHRRGIGRLLVAQVEKEAHRRGGHWLHVKTLAPSHPDPFYAQTRAFYQALGFEPLFESDALWGSENPALVLVKPLQGE
ncbi:MAG: GNAT family N-acetyltransferase [Caldilineaceae bacterium]|nr:GNAT family N-acetyltransferase [Caldilineaceae bacterium]